jgi:hypothetical protein
MKSPRRSRGELEVALGAALRDARLPSRVPDGTPAGTGGEAASGISVATLGADLASTELAALEAAAGTRVASGVGLADGAPSVVSEGRTAT